MPQLYASSTNIKLQTIQNTTLNIGCILINTQHLHDETNILPLHTNVTNKTSHNAYINSYKLLQSQYILGKINRLMSALEYNNIYYLKLAHIW